MKENKQEAFYQRTEMVLGRAGVERLQSAVVAVCGIGGVGTGAVEALVRAGVGRLRLIDFDVVSLSNLNRQLFTTQQNIGKSKVAAMAERIAEIQPACQVELLQEKIESNGVARCLQGVDAVIDAIDDIPGKLAILAYAKEQGIFVVSSMGTGNKLHPELLELADISQTSVCPLARKLRRELKKIGIENGIPVVYSKEPPVPLAIELPPTAKRTPGSVSFVPPVAGMILAGAVIRHLTGKEAGEGNGSF